MWCTHFRPSVGIVDFVDRLSCGGDSPVFVFETYFRPAGKPQFAGANKDMQGERNSQPS